MSVDLSKYDVNAYIERGMERMGRFIGRCPQVPLAIVGIMIIVFCGFLSFFEIERELFDLWTPTDSPVWKEREFIDEYWGHGDFGTVILAATHKTKGESILDVKYLQEYWEFHLQFSNQLPDMVYRWTEENEDGDEIERNVTFSFFPRNWFEPQSLTSLSNQSGDPVPHYTGSEIVPICRPFATSPLEAQLQLPCYALQIFDCFAEGGYLFPYEDYIAKTFATALIPQNPYMFKPSWKGMSAVDLGATLGPSCLAWEGTNIPFNFIYGGAKRIDPSDESSAVTELEAFETILYTDSSVGVARKIMQSKSECNYTSFYSVACPEPTSEQLEEAEDLIHKYMGKYIDTVERMTKRWRKDDSKELDVVFWTPRTTGDLLSEASSADFFLLGLAYAIMIVFAALTSLRPKDMFLSRSEASCTGVILVLFTVMATMGLGAVFWKFSPNVVQVLPFIALGFGVDDMFVLLFSFVFRQKCTPEEIIGEALRVAGSSVTLTSSANFCAFCIASFMPLPDVARFASFGMIMVILNYISVLIGFTAIMAFVCRRMHRGLNDCGWCCCYIPAFTRTKEIKSEKPPTHAASAFDPLFDFLTRDETRIICVIAFFGLAAVGVYGVTLTKVGLPLAEIVPSGSYAQDYLAVREEYFHSYSNSLYSDGHKNKLRPIDWSHKFKNWTDVVLGVRDVSKYIYDDMSAHSFWALSFKNYLNESWAATFNPYVLSSISRDPTYDATSRACELDRNEFCPSLFVNYSYGSDLYQCLDYNYESLSANEGGDSCQEYLDKVRETVTLHVAKQVQICFPERPLLEEVYYAPSDDTSNVYFSHEGRVVYQRPTDYSWIVLDNSSNALYFGRSTTPGSQPPQYGWTNPDGTGAHMTAVYYDGTFAAYQVRRSAEVTNADIPPRSSFAMDFYYMAGDDNEGGEYAFEVFQLTMEQTDVFSLTSMSTGPNNGTVVCDAILEATEMCVAVSATNPRGLIECGSVEDGREPSTFYLAECDGDFTIVSNPNEFQTITNQDACFCSRIDGNYTGYTHNYIAPAGYDDFGGNQIDTDGSVDQCSSANTDVSLRCEGVTDCSSLDVCYEDVEEHIGVEEECTEIRLRRYSQNGNPAVLRKCLLAIYPDLTDCCREATIVNIVRNRAQFTCAALADAAPDNATAALICSEADDCDLLCGETCYIGQVGPGEIIPDCTDTMVADESSPPCLEIYNGHVLNGTLGGPELIQCLNSSSEDTNCCRAAIQEAAAFRTECVLQPDTVWDYDEDLYDFSACNVSTGGTVDAGCGEYNGNATQLQCMQDNYSADRLSCCAQAIDMTIQSFHFTRECQGDLNRYSADCGGVNIANALSNNECIDTLTSLSETDQLSPNCQEILTYCQPDGYWPLTMGGESVSLSCPPGYSGNITRMCTAGTVAMWEEEDSSECAIQSCPTETETFAGKTQVWESVEYGQVQRYFWEELAWDDDLDCGQTQLAEGYRLCWHDENGDAAWRNTTNLCRTIFSFNTTGETYKNTMCGGVSSITAFVDVSQSPTRRDALDSCRSYCENVATNCMGFVYVDPDVSTSPYGEIDAGSCAMYDWCELTEAGLASEDESDVVWAVASTTLSQLVAWDCTGLSRGSSAAENGWEIVSTVSEAYNPAGIPHPTCFNETLWQYLVDPTGGVLNQGKFLLNDTDVLYSSSLRKKLVLISTSSSVLVKDIDDAEVAVTFIGDYRKWIDDEFTPQELWVVPGGLVISLYSQYIGVVGYMFSNLAWVCLAVAFTGILFLLHPTTVLVVIICDAVMIIEVYGFVDWAGLRINGVFALNLVIAIGLTMEFTAHMARAFMLQTARPGEKIGIPRAGTGQIRMKKSLREMFTPVSLGAITTFLGIAPISAAKFPYFRQYYFVLYVLIVMFGWLNGVIFQPIILSILNPKNMCAKEDDIHGVMSVTPGNHGNSAADGGEVELLEKEDDKESLSGDGNPTTA